MAAGTFNETVTATGLRLALACAGTLVLGAGSRARAQQAGVERFERNLEQIRRDTRLRVSPDVPAGQRALVDYGGYLTASYLSFDDQRDDNHAFRGLDPLDLPRRVRREEE